jgi:ABC-type transporter Mla MlaB component
MAVPQAGAITFEVRGPLARTDLPGLCDRVCALLAEGDPVIAFCEVGSLEPDAVTIDALARLQLAARRRGCQIRLRHASTELLELLEFLGLDDVLPA